MTGASSEWRAKNGCQNRSEIKTELLKQPLKEVRIAICEDVMGDSYTGNSHAG